MNGISIINLNYPGKVFEPFTMLEIALRLTPLNNKCKLNWTEANWVSWIIIIATRLCSIISIVSLFHKFSFVQMNEKWCRVVLSYHIFCYFCYHTNTIWYYFVSQQLLQGKIWNKFPLKPMKLKVFCVQS